jgi:hypothetical protein
MVTLVPIHCKLHKSPGGNFEGKEKVVTGDKFEDLVKVMSRVKTGQNVTFILESRAIFKFDFANCKRIDRAAITRLNRFH